MESEQHLSLYLGVPIPIYQPKSFLSLRFTTGSLINIFGLKTENFFSNLSTLKLFIKHRSADQINWALPYLLVLPVAIPFLSTNPVNTDSVPNAVLPIPSNGLIRCSTD